jgi:hypothetical protein
MRPLFVDGWNSFWHIFFGMVSIPVPLLAPLFLFYQFVLYYDENSIIDTLEYVIGSNSYSFISYFAQWKN